MLQAKFRFRGLKRLLQQKEGKFKCAWIEPYKRQPNGQMIINTKQMSNCGTKSIRWNLFHKMFWKEYSDIMCDNYCWKLE